MVTKFKMAIWVLLCSWMVVVGWPEQAVAAPEGPVNEIEPNNSSEQAQTLSAIGRENYVNAAISPAGDQDWYQFNAEAGVTYVVELFEVGAGVNNGSGYGCGGGSDEGIGILIYDASVTQIAYSCEPNDYNAGAGNVHNITGFTAGLAGDYYLKIIANNSSVIGSYKLRILPKYDHPLASWDESYEPNNRQANAAQILVGRENAITTNIEARIVNYATNYADVDWFWFEAEANKTYVIEVFEVDVAFNSAGGYECGGGSDEGLGINVVDVVGTGLVSSCEPNDYNAGAGNVHNIIGITPGLAGKYFFRIIPNNESLSGSYSVRVLPPHDDPAASWDEAFEPNNRQVNAAQIQVGRENAIITSIGGRIANYATNYVDADWYWFEAEANKTYVVELFNVEVAFNTASGYECGAGSDEGLGINIVDSSGTGLISSCEPNDYSRGGGNVHNLLEFTPGLAGKYFFRIIPNNENLDGTYSLRVLPQYDLPTASWDTKFEPNNVPHNSYLLSPGQTLTTDIETRLANYATNFVDRDWYRFEATAGETYVIETLNVNTALATGSGKLCQGGFSSKTGLGMRLYDPTLATILAFQCTVNGSGIVHTSLTFTPDVSGTYYIWILPNASTVSGSYSVRLGGVDAVYLPIVTR